MTVHVCLLQEADSVGHVLSLADKCNGFVLTSVESSNPSTRYVNQLFQSAFGVTEPAYELTAAVQERYMGNNKLDTASTEPSDNQNDDAG